MSHSPDSTLPSMNRRRLLAAGSVGLALGAQWNLAAAQTAATPAAASPVADEVGQLVDIGGRSLYMEIAGEGEPTVILEAGAMGRGDVWSRDQQFPAGERQMVFPAVAEFTRVMLYDRPGTIGEVNTSLDPTGPLFHPSRSDPAPMPRTIGDIVDDLRALLAAAEIPPPYVLVGHSMGGMAMRLFANLYPDEVVGLVAIDSTHEDVYVEFAAALPPDVWEEFDVLNTENPDLLAAYPDYERLTRWPLLEDPNFSMLREAQATSPLQPMPLVVLAHGIPFAAPTPEWPTEQMEEIMFGLQENIASLVPDSRLIVAEKSGHNIHQDQPKLVIESIRAVVDAVRDPATWSSE